MVISDWFKEEMLAPMLVGWRYAREDSGALFVMISGIIMKLEWSAGNWDIQPMVYHIYYIELTSNLIHFDAYTSLNLIRCYSLL